MVEIENNAHYLHLLGKPISFKGCQEEAPRDMIVSLLIIKIVKNT